MNQEMNNMIMYKVFKLIKINEIQDFDKNKILKTKWVYNTKFDQNNQLIFKARLVAGGYKQVYGFNYFDISSPTLNVDLIRLIIAFAIKNNYHIHSLDIKSAYLNADIDTDIYVKPPIGFKISNEYIYKLQKGLYGLKQSGLLWFKKFTSIIKSLNFIQSIIEPTIFYNIDRSIILAIYVDDMIITSKSVKLIKEFVLKLEQHLSLKYLGELKSILGMNFEIKNNEVLINQTDKIIQLAKMHNITSKNNQMIPIKCQKFIDPFLNEEIIDDITEYQSIVGALLWLNRCTRLDITYSVNSLSQFNNRPTKSHMKYAIQIIQYLYNTSNLNLQFIKSDIEVIIGYADADFANNKVDRKSINGNLIYYNGNPIYWSTKKQTILAQCTNEAEIITCNSICKQLMYYKNLIQTIFNNDEEVLILNDNTGSIKFAKNGATKRTKHIDIKLFYLKEMFDLNKFKIDYVPSKDNPSDLFTKSLDRETFTHLIQYLRLINK